MAARVVAVALALTVGSASATEVNITLLPLSTGAAALDGTPYGFFFVKGGDSKQWTISIQGGGWCVGEADCLSRSEMTVHDGKPGSLGSSAPLIGHPAGCRCMNTVGQPPWLASDCNCLYLPYLDGASFSGGHEAPVPVSSKPGTFLHYKGLRNLDATLDYAFTHLGLGNASEMVVTGGSAGGLSTFLHVDRVASRMRAGAANCKRTTAAPVVGYFLDHANYPGTENTAAMVAPTAALGLGYPHTGNYSSWMETLYRDQNITAALLPACLKAFPASPHLCFMSPHMVRFVASPLYMFNSRFDAWQMDNDLRVPCHAGDSPHPKCNADEQAAIVQYGSDFLNDLAFVTNSAPKNGAFITSCICHGCDWTTLTLENRTSYEHYSRWHRGADSTTRSVHIDDRMPNGAGALDSDPMCMPYP